jgi:hypothetical protein
MKQTPVEFLELMFLRILSFDSEEHRKKYKDAMRQAKELEKQQQGYSIDDLKEAFAMGRTNATIKDFNKQFNNK